MTKWVFELLIEPQCPEFIDCRWIPSLYLNIIVDTKWFQSDILENGSTLCCSFQLFVKVTKSQLLLVSRRCIYYYCYSWSRNGDKNFSCTLYLPSRSIINMSISFHRKILLILFFLCILSSSFSKFFIMFLCRIVLLFLLLILHWVLFFHLLLNVVWFLVFQLI